jgi:hypothetical protein
MLVNQDPAARDRIVYVPVQERYLGVVHSALAQAYADEMRGITPVEEPPTPEGQEAGGKAAQYSREPLTKDEIVRLKRSYDNQDVHTVLSYLADHAGQWVSFQDLMTATGNSRHELNADLGGLTKFVKRGFGKNRWPMEFEWGPEGTAIYRMSPEVARWWKEA